MGAMLLWQVRLTLRKSQRKKRLERWRKGEGSKGVMFMQRKKENKDDENGREKRWEKYSNKNECLLTCWMFESVTGN